MQKALKMSSLKQRLAHLTKFETKTKPNLVLITERIGQFFPVIFHGRREPNHHDLINEDIQE